MPELPEVETIRRGLSPRVVGKRIRDVVVRQYRLRWPVPAQLGEQLVGRRIAALERRAKYLIFRLEHGCLLLHLGMSGSLRILGPLTPADRHDHVDIIFDDSCCLRFRDPRRFGSIHWTDREPMSHPLLRHLGPEPLGSDFSAGYLYRRARRRRQSVKDFIMDGRTVAGVGNIYANEALFRSGIHPKRRAGNISLARYRALTASIRQVLLGALASGGTTLRDFVGEDGAPGYFRQELSIYGRAGQPCPVCQTGIRQVRQGQRSSYYCRRCQR